MSFRTRGFWISLDEAGAGQGSGGQAGKEVAAQGGQQGGAESERTPVEFSAEQQAKLQELLDAAYARGATKAEKTFKTEIEKLQEQLSKAVRGPDKGDKGKVKGRSDGEDDPEPERTYTKAEIQQLLAQKDEELVLKVKDQQGKVEEAEARVKQLLEKDRHAAIVSAAARHKAINPDEIAMLVGRQVAHDDDGKLIVLNDSGTGGKLGPKGEPLTVEEFVKQFLDSRPYLVNGSGQSGAGSGSRNAPSGGQAHGTPKNFSEAARVFAARLSEAK